MGLAASQVRFLDLTARKSNVEYQGQQVNQARTALADQSATLFNRLVALTVPTPPDASNTSLYPSGANDTAYTTAYAQYETKLAQYNLEYSVLNAKTEKIQQQDRSLETKLSQLDTDQRAIQTELESVKKVIEKNIENTFKTFA